MKIILEILWIFIHKYLKLILLLYLYFTDYQKEKAKRNLVNDVSPILFVYVL